MKNIVILFLILTLVSCHSRKVVFELEPSLCGEVYIIVLDSLKRKNKVVVDSNGVGYIGKEQLFYDGQYVELEVRQSGKDITSMSQNVSDGFVSYPNNDSDYNYLHFCVECEDINCSSGLFVAENLKELIKEGKVTRQGTELNGTLNQ